MLTVPLDNNGSTTFSTVLLDSRASSTNSPTTVFIKTYFNELQKMWFMDISDSSNTVFASGIAMVPNIDLLGEIRNKPIDLGQLRIIPKTSDNNPQNNTEQSISDDIVLLYFAPGEFEERYPDYFELVQTQSAAGL